MIFHGLHNLFHKLQILLSQAELLCLKLIKIMFIRIQIDQTLQVFFFLMFCIRTEYPDKLTVHGDAAFHAIAMAEED